MLLTRSTFGVSACFSASAQIWSQSCTAASLCPTRSVPRLISVPLAWRARTARLQACLRSTRVAIFIPTRTCTGPPRPYRARLYCGVGAGRRGGGARQVRMMRTSRCGRKASPNTKEHQQSEWIGGRDGRYCLTRCRIEFEFVIDLLWPPI